MIVRCDQCQTRFRLDSNLAAKSGVRLRCAHCQHIFTIPEPEQPQTLRQDSVVQEPTNCRILAICNQKGGVAKTSTCLNLGACLALLKKRVLLVDLDVQGSLSALVGVQKGPSFYEVLQTDSNDWRQILANPRPNLWLLPANGRLALLPQRYLQKKGFEYLLRDRLEPISASGTPFDYILIDTPPAINFFSLNALVAAPWIILPTQCEYLSMNGLKQMEALIAAMQRKARGHIDYRVLITLFDDKNTAARVIARKLQARYGDKLLNTRIEWDASMQESQIVQTPIIHYDRNSRSALQYFALAQEIDQGLYNQE